MSSLLSLELFYIILEGFNLINFNWRVIVKSFLYFDCIIVFFNFFSGLEFIGLYFIFLGDEW